MAARLGSLRPLAPSRTWPNLQGGGSGSRGLLLSPCTIGPIAGGRQRPRAAGNPPQFAHLLVVGRGCQLQEVGIGSQVELLAAAGDLPLMAQLQEVGIDRQVGLLAAAGGLP